MAKQTRIPDYSAKTLRTLFQPDSQFEVPLYQRGFAWTSEEVGLLLDDLQTAFRERPYEYYFLGQSIVCDGEKGWEVVDGQQRLTSLFLFLIAAINRLKDVSKDFDFNDKSAFDTLPSMIKYVDEEKLAQPRLRVASTGREHVVSLVRGDSLPLEDADLTQENVRVAFELISKHLSNEFPNDLDCFNFVWFVCTRVVIFQLELDDTQQALRVFHKMNHRGLTLDDADLLKNLLFINADSHDFADISKQWDSAGRTIFKARLKRVRSMEFLLKCLIGIETGDSIPSTKVFEEWESRLTDKPTTLTFCSHLADNANTLQLATHNLTPSGADRVDTEGTYHFNWVQHLEVLLAGRHLHPNSYQILAELVDTRCTLSTLSDEKTQDFERMVHKWAHKVKALPRVSNRAEILAASSDALSTINSLILGLRATVPMLSYTKQTERKKLRFAIALASQQAEINGGNNIVKNEFTSLIANPKSGTTKRFHLDHIYPKSEIKRTQFALTLEDNLSLSQRDQEAKADELINSIGNLALMHPDDNRLKSDDLPDSPNSQTVFASSHILLTSILSHKENLNTMVERVERVFDELKLKYPVDVTRWTDVSIFERTEMYLDLLEQHFRSELG